MRSHQPVVGLIFLAALIPACSPPSASDSDGGITTDRKRHDAAVEKDASRAVDAAAAVDASASDAGSGSGDGTPVRDACTNTFGSALSSAFGRLDGLLVSIVPPKSGSSCNEDSTHLHLQVQMNGDVYDVAVNVDGGFYDLQNIALPDGAWSEGWHGSDPLDYVHTLGLSSTEFTSISQSALTSLLESDLATANHLSVFGTAYTGSDAGSGIHDIHREATNKDGALIIDPLSPTARVYLFRFSSDTF